MSTPRKLRLAAAQDGERQTDLHLHGQSQSGPGPVCSVACADLWGGCGCHGAGSAHAGGVHGAGPGLSQLCSVQHNDLQEAAARWTGVGAARPGCARQCPVRDDPCLLRLKSTAPVLL